LNQKSEKTGFQAFAFKFNLYRYTVALEEEVRAAERRLDWTRGLLTSS
jgi:hypothetical protein